MQTGEWLWQKDEGGAVVTGYLGERTEVVVPAELDGFPVTAVGVAFPADRFFRAGRAGRHPVCSLTLPQGLRTLRGLHLSDCPRLRSLTVPGSVTTITRYALASSFLETVTVEEGDQPLELGDGLLRYAESLQSLVLPARTVTLPPYLLEGVDLPVFVVPQGIRVIGSRVFAGARIGQLMLPATIERLESEDVREGPGSDCEISRMGAEDEEEELFLYGGLYPHPTAVSVEKDAPVIPQLWDAGLFTVTVI